MNTDVVIKADSHGIRIILNNNYSIDEIIKDIKLKLSKHEAFLKKGGAVNIFFEGRILSFEEINKILYELNNMPDTGVKFIYDDNRYKPDALEHICKKSAHKKDFTSGSKNIYTPKKELEQFSEKKEAFKKKKKAFNNENYPDNLFFYGDLSGGQILETRKSIIIIGNVERKAKVISSGNIIIIGSLEGVAIAGRDLHPKRFVLALNMEPVHIKIGKADALPQKHSHKKFNTNDAVIAYCDNGQLIFNMLSQASL